MKLFQYFSTIPRIKEAFTVVETIESGLPKKQRYADPLNEDSLNLPLNSRTEITPDFDRIKIAGEVAASLAHELRNPMTSIKGFLQVLGDEKKQTLDLSTIYQLMIKEFDQMESLIVDLLSSTKLEVSEYLEVDMLALLKQAKQQTLSIAREAYINIVICADWGLPLIKCVKKQMIQVFSELFHEQINGMSEGGTLRVYLEKRNSNYLEINVVGEGTDTIPERIGEPFYSIKTKGTGLSVMVILNVIQNHGGSMKIYKTKGREVTFKILLPFNLNRH